jgi:hypothetical protein
MNSEICLKVINKLKNYKIQIKSQVFDGQSFKIKNHGDDISVIYNLTKDDIKALGEDVSYTIKVYSKDDNKLYGSIQFTLEEEDKKDVLYIELVKSHMKGFGRDLLYLITCKANELGLPIAFGAQPSITNKFEPGTSEETIRKQEEKLLQYYNHLGFTRKGDEEYGEKYGLTQHYLSDPKIVLEHAVLTGGKRTRRNKKRSRRTRSQKLKIRNNSG